MANQQNFITGQLNGVLPLVGVKSSSTGLPIVNAFIHIKYAETEPVQNADMQDAPNDWIGIYAGTGPTAPSNFNLYTWQRIKGLTGQQGPAGADSVVPGPQGPIGLTGEQGPQGLQGEVGADRDRKSVV